MNGIIKLLPVSILTSGIFSFQTPKLNAETKQKSPNILIAIADDWSYPHAGTYGCKWVSTPAFDYVAQNGILFSNFYTANAKSAPSRACLLTGRNSWQLEEAGNHITNWPENKYETIFEALLANGYDAAYTGKGWAPGNPGVKAGKNRELTGKEYNQLKLIPPTAGISACNYAGNFESFLNENNGSKPWIFWYGGLEPHREYEYASGIAKGAKSLTEIDAVPKFWPDNDTVRTDMLDYALEIEHFDHHLGKIIQLLREKGELDNTIIIVTADNGMPFPRAKGLQYDFSTHLPLAIMWPKGIVKPGRTETDLVSIIDIAPTIVRSTSLKQSPVFAKTSGRTMQDIFADKKQVDRSFIVLGQERHDYGRPMNQGYPIRSIIQGDYLYVYNFKPDLWPVGNPETGYLNTDGSPTKGYILNQHRQGKNKNYWELNFGFHQQEELYNLKTDRACLYNLSDKSELMVMKMTLKKKLFAELKKQKDPRVLGKGDVFDKYPFANKESWNFYERYMRGEIKSYQTKWVNPSDYEKKFTK